MRFLPAILILFLLAVPTGELRAEEAAPRRLSSAEIAKELAQLGVALTLPAGVTGELERIFDTRVLVIRLGAHKVYLAPPSADARPCSVETLIVKEKEERGFREVARRGTDPVIPIAAAAMRGSDGKDRFLVEACTPAGGVLCGADEIVDAAMMTRVWELCSTMRDVPPSAALLAARAGRYSTVFLDDDAGDRAAGRGGSGQRVRATIDLQAQGTEVHGTYSVAADKATAPAATAALTQVRIMGDRFSAAPISVKAAWPLYLPGTFEGRFIEPDVLFVGGKRYERKPTQRR